jgi:hypothetical protein
MPSGNSEISLEIRGSRRIPTPFTESHISIFPDDVGRLQHTPYHSCYFIPSSSWTILNFPYVPLVAEANIPNVEPIRWWQTPS